MSDTEGTAAVAALVKKLRAKKKLTLRALAAKTKLSYQAVHRLEHGDGSVRAARIILTELGVSAKKCATLIMGMVAA